MRDAAKFADCCRRCWCCCCGCTADADNKFHSRQTSVVQRSSWLARKQQNRHQYILAFHCVTAARLTLRYSHDNPEEETQLSLTYRATHLCKCNDVADLTSVIKIHLKKNRFLTSGLSTSLNVIGSNTNRPAVFSSNCVPKTHRFRDSRLQKCCDLENRVRCPSRSLKMSPFDRAHVTSC